MNGEILLFKKKYCKLSNVLSFFANCVLTANYLAHFKDSIIYMDK